MACSVQRRPINATMRKIYSLEFTGASRRKGRPKKTWIEAVTYDTNAFNLIDKIVLDQTEREHKIYVADHSYSD